jgi:hypothetical protein
VRLHFVFQKKGRTTEANAPTSPLFAFSFVLSNKVVNPLAEWVFATETFDVVGESVMASR